MYVESILPFPLLLPLPLPRCRWRGERARDFPLIFAAGRVRAPSIRCDDNGTSNGTKEVSIIAGRCR